MRSLTLGDLRVGDVASRPKEISAADVDAFAAMSGDFNPLHMEREFAARFGFERRVAHGALAIGVAAGVLGTMLPGLGTVALSVSVDFLAPVLVGDTVTADAEVVAIDRERGQATLELRWTDQRGQLVARGEAVVRPPREAITLPRSPLSCPRRSQNETVTGR